MFRITKEDIEALKLNLPYVAIIALAWGIHFLFARNSTLQEKYDALQHERIKEKQDEARYWREAYKATNAAYLNILKHENIKNSDSISHLPHVPERSANWP